MERKNNLYIICAPDSPTHYPYNKRRPDILDIAMINLPFNFNIQNHIDLSSDHNPIQIHIKKTPTSNLPPKPMTRINWKKFHEDLQTNITLDNKPYNTKSKIDVEIEKITNQILTSIENNTTTNSDNIIHDLPPKIQLEIKTNRILRSSW